MYVKMYVSMCVTYENIIILQSIKCGKNDGMDPDIKLLYPPIKMYESF